jgi:hypothetical protein
VSVSVSVLLSVAVFASNPAMVGCGGGAGGAVVGCSRGLVAGLMWMGVWDEGGLGGESGCGGAEDDRKSGFVVSLVDEEGWLGAEEFEVEITTEGEG